MSFPSVRATLLFTSVLAAGCGGGGGGLGITQGGAQDMALARAIIGTGGIPNAEQFTAEGLFSEHDLPLPGGSCERDLCPRAAAALIDPLDGRGPRALVHLGFATRHGEDFERRPLNVAAAVDVSGSMGTDKMEAVRTALHAMVDQLDDGDRMSLVRFAGHARRMARPTVMNSRGRRRLHAKIDKLRSGGGTDIEAGLRKATAQVRKNAGTKGVEDRVLLFTDAQPNIGATDTGSFLGMVEQNAVDGIGISVFGVGLDLGAELATSISEVRGGNSFYLADDEAIASVFDDEFDMIVSPVAYDLNFSMVPNELFRFDQAFGVPGSGSDPSATFSVSTLFLSRRGGGMAALLDGPIVEGQFAQGLGTIALSYETNDGTHREDQIVVEWNGGTTHETETVHADHLGVAKMGALVDEYLALEAAAATCDSGGSSENAAGKVGIAVERLAAMALETEDPKLSAESGLMEKLLANLDDGQCDPIYDEQDW